MKQYRLIISLFIILAAGSNAKAQLTISLEQARALALDRNKNIRVARLKIEEAEASEKAAFTQYLPKIEANSSCIIVPELDDIEMEGSFLPTANSLEDARAGNYSGVSDVYFPGFQLGLDELIYYTADVSLSQPIYAGGKIRNGNKMAAIASGISKSNLELSTSQLMEETDKAYYTVLAVKESLILAEKYLELLSELEEQLQDSYELGLTPRSDLLQVRVQKNQAELNEIQARNGLKLAKMKVCQIIGLAVHSNIETTDSLLKRSLLPDTAGATQTALSLRRELDMLNKQIEISELERKNVRADFLPEIGIGASYQYSKVKDLSDDQWNTILSGQISIPLFHWREGKHKVRAAMLRKKQLEVQKDRARDLISLEVSQAITRLDESMEAIELAKKSKAEAEESLQETQAGYDAGLSTITQILDAQASWQQAHKELIRALTNFEIAKAHYKRVIGK